jgi:hypothetical protein
MADWQPMETIPRDGFDELILADADGSVLTGIWDHAQRQFVDPIETYWVRNPIAWMHLPCHPEAASDD